MAAPMDKTRHPGIYRRHVKDRSREERCDCSYVVVWRHRGRQHKETFRTLAEAREAKGNRDAGDRRPVARVGFGDYFDQWIGCYAGRTSRGFTERSRALYRGSLEQHALPRWGSWRLADVEPADVREMYSALRDDGVSVSGVKGVRAALSAMFATAVEDRLLRSNPIRGVRIPGDSEEEQAAKALTRAELALVLEALPPNWRLFFELLVHTGLRISEAIGLTWAQLDLGARPRGAGPRTGIRRRAPKTQVEARPPGHSTVRGMADRLRARRRDTYQGEAAPVFATVGGAELSRPNLAGRVLKPAAKSVGLGWVSFHTFRHTCASLLFEGGKNVKQVQEWLGHADPAFTLGAYVHLMDEGLGDADFLDAAVTTSAPAPEAARVDA